MRGRKLKQMLRLYAGWQNLRWPPFLRTDLEYKRCARPRHLLSLPYPRIASIPVQGESHEDQCTSSCILRDAVWCSPYCVCCASSSDVLCLNNRRDADAACV